MNKIVESRSACVRITATDVIAYCKDRHQKATLLHSGEMAFKEKKAAPRLLSVPPRALRLCLISDTHGLHRELDIPECEILIHAGEFAMFGNWGHIQDFNLWLEKLPVRHRIVVTGNHDAPVADEPGLVRHAKVLINSGIKIDGLRIWGVPWSWPLADRKCQYDRIPIDTDVLITHVPPYGILDSEPGGDHGGDPLLRNAVDRVSPRLHICGHIHSGRGMQTIGDTMFVNAALLTKWGELGPKPFLVQIRHS